MPSIFGASSYNTLRARDGVNYDLLAILQGLPIDTTTGLNAPIMTWGPGATVDVPGTRLYWMDSTVEVWRTNGVVVEAVPGSPAVGSSVAIFYDRATDTLYYVRDLAPALAVDTFTVAGGWTSLGNALANGGGYGSIGQIPTTAVSGPGQIVVCGGNEVRRWDGAVWLLDLATVAGFVTPITVAPLPTTGELVSCNDCTRAVAQAADPVIQLRSTAGAWADVTPASWQLAGAGNARQCWCAVEFNGELYACFTKADLSRREIMKRDAAGVWTLELDLGAELPPDGYVYSFAVIDGVLHCGMDRNFTGNYYLTKDGSGWHQNVLPFGIQTPGFESSIQFFLEAPEGTIDPPAGNCSGEYGAEVRVAGFWDGQQFVAWTGAVWDQNRGLWTAIAGVIGTQVFIGNGVEQYVGHGNVGSDWTVGEIDVVDPFVLTGSPPNGAGLANVQVDNSLAPGHGLLGDANFPLWLPNGYEFLCPAIASVDPANGSLLGGYTVTLHGENFYSNLINPQNVLNRARVVNRIWVRTSGGRVVEVDSRTIVFVDTETIEFPMAPYPGGTDPIVEVLFRPAGLAPFIFGSPYGINPYYQCARVEAAFTYTGVVFAILGSLETLLGLGGTGADIAFPGSGGGPVGSVIACPTPPDAGPCIR